MAERRRLWVTRAEPGAQETAERLRALGHDPVVQPVLGWRVLADARIDLAGAAALAFTSRNGVAAFAQLSARRSLPAFAVGDATAAAARQTGFEDVRSAGGDVDALARLIGQARPSGVVVHLSAAEPAGDLAGALHTQGVDTRTIPVYESFELDGPAPSEIDCVLVHSPRGGRRAAALLGSRTDLAVFAISAAAAAPFAALNFRHVSVAQYPDEASLLKLLET